MSELLHRRLRQMRSRVLIRQFDFRQRHHARGVWYRLRLRLSLAKEAWIISAGDARRLVEEGLRSEPVGEELQPPRVLIYASAERLAQIEGARRIPVRLSAELLSAECLALVPFSAKAFSSPQP